MPGLLGAKDVPPAAHVWAILTKLTPANARIGGDLAAILAAHPRFAGAVLLGPSPAADPTAGTLVAVIK